MGIIKVEGIKLYAYHGCLPEEGIVGGNYEVNITINTNLIKSAISDDLSDTVDYVMVYTIVKEEMLIRAKLIENVGYRIKERLRHVHPTAQFEVEIIKNNPPINGDVTRVSIIV